MKIILLLIGKNSFIDKSIYKELKKINYIQVDKEKI